MSVVPEEDRTEGADGQAPGVAFRGAAGTAVASTVDALLGMRRDGHLAAGASLPPQRELADLLDVSRATLREAISVLVTTGEVVPRENGRGFLFADPDIRGAAPAWPSAARYSLREVFQCRHVIESHAAQLATLARTPEDLAGLRQSLDAFRMAASHRDLTAYAEEDFRFHARIITIAGNRLFADIHSMFASVLLESQKLPALRPGDLWAAVKEHEAILEAIERRDPDGAHYYMRKHISMGGSRSGLPVAELP